MISSKTVHSAILGVFNSAVPVVQPVPVNAPQFAIRPPPGGVSAFAAAQQVNGPSGSNFNAQTGVSQGRN